MSLEKELLNTVQKEASGLKNANRKKGVDFKCNLRKRKIISIKLPTQGEGNNAARGKKNHMDQETKEEYRSDDSQNIRIQKL